MAGASLQRSASAILSDDMLYMSEEIRQLRIKTE